MPGPQTQSPSKDGFSSLPEAVPWQSNMEVCCENGKEVAGADGMQRAREDSGKEIAGADGMQRVKEDNEKELVGADGMEAFNQSEALAVPSQEDDGVEKELRSESKPMTIYTRRWFKWLWLALVALVIAAIGLGLGLGLGLRSGQ